MFPVEPKYQWLPERIDHVLTELDLDFSLSVNERGEISLTVDGERIFGYQQTGAERFIAWNNFCDRYGICPF